MVKVSLLITATYLICFSVISASDLGDAADFIVVSASDLGSATNGIVQESGHQDTRGVVQLDENNRQIVPFREERVAVAQQLTIEQIKELLGVNRIERVLEEQSRTISMQKWEIDELKLEKSAQKWEIDELKLEKSAQKWRIDKLELESSAKDWRIDKLELESSAKDWRIDKFELEKSAENTSHREKMLKEYVLWIEYASLYKDAILAMQNEKEESDRFISTLKRKEREAYQKLPPHCHARVRIMKGGKLVPSMAAGLEDLFEFFLNMRLVYRPNLNNETGIVEIPFSSLTNTLTGTFDLAQCGDAGKYLSINTGYRESKKTANSDKVEIWISPRFFVEDVFKKLGQNTEYYHHIMEKWNKKFLVGVFFTFGNWEKDVFYGNISGKIDYPSNMLEVIKNSAKFNQRKYDESWMPAKMAYNLSGYVPKIFQDTGCFPPLEKEYMGRDVIVGYKNEIQEETCFDSSCKKVKIRITPTFGINFEDEKPGHTHEKVVKVPVYEWKEYDTQEEKQKKLNELLAARGAYHYIQHFSLYIS